MICPKVNAFTLIELVISMLITSILAAIIYTSLFFFFNRQNELVKKNESILEVASFSRAIVHDFDVSSYVSLDDGNVYCTGDSSQIKYAFEDDQVIRQLNGIETAVDTFQFKCSQLQYFLYGKEVAGTSGIIDALTFQAVDHRGDQYSFFVQRSYTMAERMSFEIMKKNDGRVKAE